MYKMIQRFNIKPCLYIVLFTLSNIYMLAQQQNNNLIKHNGKYYYLHIVQKGETLYGLSKLYTIPIDSIVQHNMFIKENGLKLHDEIIIPVKEINLPVITQNKKNDIIKHTVKKGETLYSISKMYDVFIDTIVFYNPIIKLNGLKENMELTIYPTSKSTSSAFNTTEIVKKDSITNYSEEPKNHFQLFKSAIKNLQDTSVDVKKEFSVAVLLPFYLKQNDSTLLKRDRIYPKSNIALDIYTGILAAKDSLELLGYSVSLRVYDVDADTVLTTQILKNNRLDTFDLVIGPLHKSSFMLVAEYLKKYSIPIVCPVQNTSKILESSPNAYKIFPSQSIEYTKLGDYICKNHSKDKLIIIDFESQNQGIGKQLKSKFNLLHSFDEKFIQDSAVYINMKTVNISKITPHLSATKKNILLLMCDDNVFLSDFINKIQHYAKDQQILLFGSDILRELNNLDFDQLQTLNTHFSSSYDFKEMEDGLLYNKISTTFSVPINKYVLAGFNTLFYFNPTFNNSYTTYGMRFNFYKASSNYGYENSDVYIFKLSDYSYVKVL